MRCAVAVQQVRVATTMNVYGSATLKAKQKANSKVVQMVIAQPKPQPELQAMAV